MAWERFTNFTRLPDRGKRKSFIASKPAAMQIHPPRPLALDAAGNLYGTASAGGGQSCNRGGIFKLTRLGSSWSESVMHGFAGDPDGALPYYGLPSDAAGNLYGTTLQGGVSNQGAIFRFMP